MSVTIYIYVYIYTHTTHTYIHILSDRNYKNKFVIEQIFKARATSREKLLTDDRNPQVEDRLVLNLMYHPLLRDFQKFLNEAQILLTPNEEHKAVFGEKPPMIGWLG